MRLIFFSLFSVLFFSCQSEQQPQNQYFEAKHKSFTYSGRTLNTAEGVELITSAASVKANVSGDTVTVFLKSKDEQHHYVAVELNQEYKGRFRVTKDTLKFALPQPDTLNTIAIFKETEAANGPLIFNGMRAQKIEKTREEKRAKIEFIGDSITCGMGADTSQINCEEGEWFDQHNAYMSYGARVARDLDVDFELNCVSGIGVYRNWNNEDQSVMPKVYPYLYLNDGQGKRAELKKEDAPDLVSIALGTNDFFKGDEESERQSFEAEKFRKNYIEFIETIFKTYPDTKIALLSSPMTGKEEGKELTKILNEIKAEFADQPVEVFEFQKMNLKGCSGHPGIKDHQIMAKQLLPFYRELLNLN